jgi:hypothetical protein
MSELNFFTMHDNVTADVKSVLMLYVLIGC